MSSSVICILNIDYQATFADVKAVCKSAGNVVRLYLAPPTLRNLNNRGYAFCEYEDNETAGEAIERLHGRLVLEREWRVYQGWDHPSNVVPPRGWNIRPPVERQRKRTRSIADLDVVQDTEDFLNSLDVDLPLPPPKVPRLDEVPKARRGQHVDEVLNNLIQLSMDEILTLPPKVREIVFALCTELTHSAH